MQWLVKLTLLCVISSFLLLFSRSAPTASLYHIIFTLGIIPLILGAIIYFTPVLTRTQTAPPQIFLFPVLALVAGILVVSRLYGVITIPFMIPALLLNVVIIGLSYWMVQRQKKCLGTPHPCFYWYLAALGCLFVAVTVMGLTHWFPEHWQVFKRFHLHLNILGFIGLTAFSTLQVLLPTTAQYSDKETGKRLQQDLKFAVIAVILLSIGIMLESAVLGIIGGIVYMAVVARFLWCLYDKPCWKNQPSQLLSLTLVHFFILLLFGLLHSLYLAVPDNTILLFFTLFLIPLIIGASSWLLPLWWYAPQERDKQLATRTSLVAWHKELLIGCYLSAFLLLISAKATFIVIILVGITYLSRIIKSRWFLD